MNITNWERIALIIFTGDIGNKISEYLKSISPKLDVISCGRDLCNQNSIYLDLEDDDSFKTFDTKLSSLEKPLRLVINTSGFIHSNYLKPEKRRSHLNLSNIIKNFLLIQLSQF